MLAKQQRRYRCRHQRRCTARQRIDLAEIAGLVGFGKPCEIEQMNDD